ncbi:MAG TPA: pilin [Candidatus Paceibacterota bacterium]|nr:pilin [Candidatus Paceibacterota bacterium]
MQLLAAATPYTIPNPLGTTDITALFSKLSTALFQIAIPVAVVMYVWAGIMLLVSRGEPGRVTKAKQIFLYTTIGLVVIFAASGLVSLIQSIFNAGQ